MIATRALVDEDGTLRCPQCRLEVAAEVPLIDTLPPGAGGRRIGGPATVLVDGPHPAGNLVMVPAGDVGWRVRYRTDSEHTVNVDGSRRREHDCEYSARSPLVTV